MKYNEYQRFSSLIKELNDLCDILAKYNYKGKIISLNYCFSDSIITNLEVLKLMQKVNYFLLIE